MLPGFYSAATGLNAAELNQEIVARNLAHVNVPGYRRSVVTFEAFQAAMQPANSLNAKSGLGTLASEVYTDFSEGSVEPTGRPLDLAINGDSFFVVEGANGPLYTRAGVFHLTDNGQFVDANGRRVLGTSGPLSVPPSTSPSQITITRDGAVHVRGTQVGQLKLASFSDNRQLIPVGTTSFAAPAGVSPADSEATVTQGARERSNVQAVEELVRMIVGLRHYEASQRALRAIDESVEQNTNPQAG